MEPNTVIPKYNVRGFEIWGFRDMAQVLDHLLGSGPVKNGHLGGDECGKAIKSRR